MFIFLDRTLLLIKSIQKLVLSKFCEVRIHTFKLKAALYCNFFVYFFVKGLKNIYNIIKV